jgi:hypothetical protein
MRTVSGEALRRTQFTMTDFGKSENALQYSEGTLDLDVMGGSISSGGVTIVLGDGAES